MKNTFITVVILTILVACQGKPKDSKICTNNFFISFCKDESDNKNLLLPALLCSLNNVLLDTTPYPSRHRLLDLVDRNYKTNLSNNISCGAEVNIFTESVRDILHFNRIIELRLNDNMEAIRNKKLLDIVVSDDGTAFKSENTATPAYFLRTIRRENKIYLVFSGRKSNFCTLIETKLDSISTLR